MIRSDIKKRFQTAKCWASETKGPFVSFAGGGGVETCYNLFFCTPKLPQSYCFSVLFFFYSWGWQFLLQTKKCSKFIIPANDNVVRIFTSHIRTMFNSCETFHVTPKFVSNLQKVWTGLTTPKQDDCLHHKVLYRLIYLTYLLLPLDGFVDTGVLAPLSHDFNNFRQSAGEDSLGKSKIDWCIKGSGVLRWDRPSGTLRVFPFSYLDEEETKVAVTRQIVVYKDASSIEVYLLLFF